MTERPFDASGGLAALRPLWILLGLVGLLALAGCGGGSSDGSASDGGGQGRSTAELELESPAVGADGTISPRVSCGSGTIWLPLKWGSPPSGTKELVLYWGRFEEGKAQGSGVKVSFAAVVTGISPALRGMAANTFPAGVEYQYFISIKNCPPARAGQRFLVELFAFDWQRAVPPDDRFAAALAEEALSVERPANESQVASEFRDEALASDRFVAVYAPS